MLLTNGDWAPLDGTGTGSRGGGGILGPWFLGEALEEMGDQMGAMLVRCSSIRWFSGCSRRIGHFHRRCDSRMARSRSKPRPGSRFPQQGSSWLALAPRQLDVMSSRLHGGHDLYNMFPRIVECVSVPLRLWYDSCFCILAYIDTFRQNWSMCCCAGWQGSKGVLVDGCAHLTGTWLRVDKTPDVALPA